MPPMAPPHGRACQRAVLGTARGQTQRGIQVAREFKVERSMGLYKEALEVLPVGVSSNARLWRKVCPVGMPCALFVDKAEGSRIWDVDGNEYIDYPMGLGSVILGHNYPATTQAIREQLEQGYSFSLMHPLEVEVSEQLRQLIPCAEMVRFGKNGSDVTAGAVRVARAHTGRDIVACCGYHGWQDWYIGTTSRSRGVPNAVRALSVPFEFNNLESLQRVFTAHVGNVAAVIMEPYGATMPAEGFLQAVRDLTHEHGAILIFDEVATGFRFHLGGIHQYFGVDPDLACFGKAMANGMPIAALVGRADVMAVLDDVFFSFTFGGDCLSLVSTRATIAEMRAKNVITHLWEVGGRLKAGFDRLAADHGMEKYVECVGLSPRTFVVFRDIGSTPAPIVKSLFQQEVLKRGVLALSTAHAVSFSHTVEDIEYTLGVYQEAFEILVQAMREGRIAERLEGRPVQPVFRLVT